MFRHYLVIQRLRSFWRFKPGGIKHKDTEKTSGGVRRREFWLGPRAAVVCFIATYLCCRLAWRSDMHFSQGGAHYSFTPGGGDQSDHSASFRYFAAGGRARGTDLRVDFPGLELWSRAVELGPQSSGATDDRKANIIAAAIDLRVPADFFDSDVKAGEPGRLDLPAHGAIYHASGTAEPVVSGRRRRASGRHIIRQNPSRSRHRRDWCVPQALAHGDVPVGQLAFDISGGPMKLLKENRSKMAASVCRSSIPTARRGATTRFFPTCCSLPHRVFHAEGISAAASAFAEHVESDRVRVASSSASVPVSHLTLQYGSALLGRGNAMSVATNHLLLEVDEFWRLACVNYGEPGASPLPPLARK